MSRIAQQGGFEWVDCADSQNSVISFLRKGADKAEQVLAVFNFTPVVRQAYEVGVDYPGQWRELLNSDAEIYWGSGVGNLGRVEATGPPRHGRPHSLKLNLPPLGALLLQSPKGK